MQLIRRTCQVLAGLLFCSVVACCLSTWVYGAAPLFLIFGKAAEKVLDKAIEASLATLGTLIMARGLADLWDQRAAAAAPDPAAIPAPTG